MIRFTVNGRHYNMSHYLVDDIYPKEPTFVKTVPRPFKTKMTRFALKHELAGKVPEQCVAKLLTSNSIRFN